MILLLMGGKTCASGPCSEKMWPRLTYQHSIHVPSTGRVGQKSLLWTVVAKQRRGNDSCTVLPAEDSPRSSFNNRHGRPFNHLHEFARNVRNVGPVGRRHSWHNADLPVLPRKRFKS